MCFSAEASFTMGTALSVIGVLCLKQIKQKNLALIGMFPLIFGIQQFAEGIVWLHMHGTLESTHLSRAAQTVFLFFAWLFWPVFVPISFYLPEKERVRKAVCAFAFLIGLMIISVDARFLLNTEVTATVVGRSIYYPASPYYGNLFYGLSTLLPIFFSSIRHMWVFGLCLLVSFLAAEAIWHFTFTSVWCFFASASSLVLLKILSDVKKQH